MDVAKKVGCDWEEFVAGILLAAIMGISFCGKSCPQKNHGRAA
jgi:hypothetical protein